ncbi:MAG: Phosphatidylserine decarboxylase proenzyme [Candidatus Ordinivivax streblomastigis]|uniref:Phosphatidylserine decarboxylase proenzyme n=1 Tax=Candidatus Ordinivivax streblomastigis TaxID=2540710 RepID=A0A5M8P0I1_9BACT|nr:MAG: Phosphatidylserine decarboxylase proenzyme [Candidatus Ordinivivax streblomastigis]
MTIHKEGRKIILVVFLFLSLLNIGLYYFASKALIFGLILALSLILFCFVVNFFRSPRCRFSGNTDRIVIAPADGKVVVIEEVFETEYFQEKRLQISIFMSLTNVHVNWVPVNGTIVHYSHQNGRFRAAYLPKSSAENERSTVVIRRENGEDILVRQIAGAMAKRIVTYAQEGNDCRINEQLGFIKFGSRVDLFLPLDSEIQVKLDQRVDGNQDIIALLK